MTTNKNFTVRETPKIDGGAYRWIEFTDGSSMIEGWGPNGWTPGGASFGEFFETPPVSPRFAAELGIPLADVTIEREKPNTATAPPKRPTLSEMVDLAVKMAAADARLKHDRYRTKLVHMLKARAWDLACRRCAPGHA